jgi:hypothetical protein
LETPVSNTPVTIQFDFAIPVTSADRILIGDVDHSEAYTVQAFTLSGATYTAVNLSGWTEQNISGQTGVLPNSSWASWTVSPDGLTGSFSANTGGELNEPYGVLTPNQSIDRIIFTKLPQGNGSAVFNVISGAAVPEPGTIAGAGLAASLCIWRFARRQFGRNVASDAPFCL